MPLVSDLMRGWECGCVVRSRGGTKQDKLKTQELFNPAKKGLRERTMCSEGEVQRTVSISKQKAEVDERYWDYIGPGSSHDPSKEGILNSAVSYLFALWVLFLECL